MYSTAAQIPRIKDYVVMQLLMMIPIVGFILLIVWAVGADETPQWKINYARASLIVMIIGVALAFVIAFITVFAIIAAFGSVVPAVLPFFN